MSTVSPHRASPNFPRLAMITGSTGGIGWEMAKAFAKEGYGISLSGLTDDGPGLARALRDEFGVDAHYSAGDLSTYEGCQTLLREASAHFKAPVTVLVNNAGIQHVAPVETFPIEKWQKIINLNLSACFYLAQGVWNGMRERKFGRIVNVASAHGLVASEYKSAYVAAKHGVIGLTKTLALEGAPHGITCNAICPGYVRTPIVEGQLADQSKVHGIPPEEVATKILLAKHAVKEFVPISLVVDTALFMASEGARTMSGIALPLDGGWTAQ